MTTTYVECPQCGKRALAVATRCPHCGIHFPPHPLNRPSEDPSLGPTGRVLAAGAAVLVVVLVAVTMYRGSAPTGGVPAAVARPDSALPSPAETPAPVAVAESTARPPRTAPAPSPARPSTRRYAKTWVNVRGGRARSAPALATLNPGDAVTVDSLVGGWYRVLVDGRAVGYVHRSMLAVTPPE